MLFVDDIEFVPYKNGDKITALEATAKLEVDYALLSGECLGHHPTACFVLEQCGRCKIIYKKDK